MKARTIEDIREHLAKGGRVLAVINDGSRDEVLRVEKGRIHAQSEDWEWSSQFRSVDVDHWELLPIEEEQNPLVNEMVCDLEKFRDDLRRDRGNICNELPDEDAMDPYTQRKQQLRKKVLHGYTWTQEEQREVWHLLTGEVVEPGKRCSRCNGEGSSWRFDDCESSMSRPKQCPKCHGTGYERQPTWMEAK